VTMVCAVAVVLAWGVAQLAKEAQHKFPGRTENSCLSHCLIPSTWNMIENCLVLDDVQWVEQLGNVCMRHSEMKFEHSVQTFGQIQGWTSWLSSREWLNEYLIVRAGVWQWLSYWVTEQVKEWIDSRVGMRS